MNHQGIGTDCIYGALRKVSTMLLQLGGTQVAQDNRIRSPPSYVLL